MKNRFKAIIVDTERKGLMNTKEPGEALDLGERKGVSNSPFKVLEL